MKISLKTLQVFVILFFIAVWAQPISGKTQSKPIPADCIPLLNKGNIAYDHLQYSLAAPLFESFLKKARSNDRETLLKLSDCYWQMREYDKFRLVMKKVDTKDSTKLSIRQRIQLSALAARMENYTQAASLLRGIKGYESKVAGYQDPAALDYLKKDSANWHISNLDINTDFREFSPYLTDSLMIFCSNSPSTKSERSFGWDGKSYVRLWCVPIIKVASAPLNKKSTKSQVNKNVTTQTKLLSPVYEGSDTKPIERSGVVTNGINYIGLKNLGKVRLLGGLSNLKYNVGPASVDTNNLIYFSVNQNKTGNDYRNRISIMQGHLTAKGVTNLKRLPFGDNNKYSVMHPAIDRSGRLLVFSSDKPDGKGGFDLYYTRRATINAPWDTPQPFSANVNTVGNEVFPYCSPDSILYFSSDGKAGFGGLDIYRIPMKDALNGVGEPELIGYPINSSSDDFGWVQDKTLKSGYFTSDRQNGNDNIYEFSTKNILNVSQNVDKVIENKSIIPVVPATAPVTQITEKVAEKPIEPVIPASTTPTPQNSVTVVEKPNEPTPATSVLSHISGMVIESKSGKPMSDATVFLYNKTTNQVLVDKTDDSGRYNFDIKNTDDFVVKGIVPNCKDQCYSRNIDGNNTQNVTSDPSQNLLMELDFKNVWVLDNVLYDFNKWNIRKDAEQPLDSVVKISKKFPTIHIELSSHTDVRGSAAYNMILSQKRAESAVKYIVKHGVNKARITAKGYGKSQLKVLCPEAGKCPEEVHQANRRTEIKVIYNPTPANSINPTPYKKGEVYQLKDFPANFFNDCK